MISARVTLIGCLLLSAFAGCGGGANDAPPLASVKGVVKLGGAVLPSAVVTFYPEKGPPGIGIGNEQGAFTVKTNGQNGCPLGKCKVTVAVGSGGAANIPPSDGNEMALLEKPRLNPKYSNADTTDLIVDVSADGHADLQLDLD